MILVHGPCRIDRETFRKRVTNIHFGSTRVAWAAAWGSGMPHRGTEATQSSLSDGNRSRWLSIAGVAMIVLSAGAALLPVEKGISGGMIGALLLTAGLIELAAGRLRRDTRDLATLAGALTVLAGLLFQVNRESKFFPTVNIVIGWLLLRSIVLAVKSR